VVGSAGLEWSSIADLNDDMNLAPVGKKGEKKPFPWLVVGGGLAAAGAVWWFFLRKKPEDAAAEQKEEVVKTSGEEFSTVGLDGGGTAAAAATGGAAAGFAKGKGAKGRSITTAQALLQQGLRSQKGMVRQMLTTPQKFRPSQASGSTRTAASLPVQRTPIAPPSTARRR